MLSIMSYVFDDHKVVYKSPYPIYVMHNNNLLQNVPMLWGTIKGRHVQHVCHPNALFVWFYRHPLTKDKSKEKLQSCSYDQVRFWKTKAIKEMSMRWRWFCIFTVTIIWPCKHGPIEISIFYGPSSNVVFCLGDIFRLD